MELNDKEFDAAFREKVFDAEPQFEEAAWNKMEQKLRRRERVVFFRKTAVLSLFLLIAFGSYYALFRKETETAKPLITKEDRSIPQVIPEAKPSNQTRQQLRNAQEQFTRKVQEQREYKLVINDDFKAVAVKDSIVIKNTEVSASISTTSMMQDTNVVASKGSDVEPVSVNSIVSKKKNKQRNQWPVSLSLSIGPEFNSSEALIGGKRGFSAGLGLSVGIAKKIKLQTGLKYSIKDYGTEGYEYAFANEKVKWIVSHVDASCAVLEVPLQASLTVMDDSYRSIDLNVGMSSYFMLKEDYRFKYTAESGYDDRLQEFNNKNQHYFGVIDLSATYYMKLKKEKVSIGLEPYVKIPVTGVGEGKINLKSSGVALKLRYDLGKNSK